MNRTKRNIILLGIVSLISCAGYLFISGKVVGIGFPLDDAWIHQTFARNYAETMRWSFQGDQLSGGSTGPAYGILLAGLYILKIPAVWGTHFLGFLMLWGISVGSYLLVEELIPDQSYSALLCGILIPVEWHLVWSALSGMETMLLALISVYLFYWQVKGSQNYWIPGLMIGASIWIRPDGITLLGPVMLSWLFLSLEWRKKILKLGHLLTSLAILAGAYFAFNQAVAGDFWPNTFFAKQAEYAALREELLLIRFSSLSLQTITGIGVVLLPGLIREAVDMVKERDWTRIGFFAWMIGYLGIYAWRLPVIYQHGRYIMPMMPVYFLLGGMGLIRMLKLHADQMWVRVLSRSALIAGVLILAVFWGLGARAYARDVGVIETEMVQTARWIGQNTAVDAVIGAHDIGALAYFGDRQILDLAGLVSPDVIPFIRDERKLAEYLDQKRADYLVVFPDWYPSLVRDLQIVHQGSGEFARLFDMKPMAVYFWK